MSTSLPAEGLLRVRAILGDRKRGIEPLVPVGATSWWTGVKSGRYPKPVRLGPRMVAWRVQDIRDLIERLAAEPAPPTAGAVLAAKRKTPRKGTAKTLEAELDGLI